MLKIKELEPTSLIWGLDIETAPTVLSENPYALEPYRCGKTTMITSVALCNTKGYRLQLVNDNNPIFNTELRKMLVALEGEIVYCHNTIFDTSYMLASCGIPFLKKIKWRDTAILYKYLVNGQKADEKRLSYSLVACVGRMMKDHPDYEAFIHMKEDHHEPGESEEYWLKRGYMDAEMTCLLAQKLLKSMTPEMYPGYMMASSAILPLAIGYVEGIPINRNTLNLYDYETTKKMGEIEKELGISGSVMSSPTQLGRLLFDVWKLEPIGFTPKGAPSTNAENMLRLHQRYADNDKLQLIMDYRKLKTMMSKYVDGLKKATAYLGEDKIHGSPKILSTITGRMTYGSKIFKKFPISIAMHQLPRKEKAIKRCMEAPPGYKVMYMDISAQEGRLMAMLAPEPTMIRAYNKGIDLHSDLTEEIFGTPYEDIMRANYEGKPEHLVEQRQAGKLTGLSSFYRIGAKSLAAKFFSTYEYDISVQTAFSYLNSFKRKYPGVPEYWGESINEAKQKGYVEAIGGFRYRIHKFDWKGESAAINHKIQGSGAIQTYTTIGVVARKFPEVILVAQVHDSLSYFIPEEGHVERATEIKTYLDTFDYGSILNFNQTVPMVMDVAVGDNFADLTTVGVYCEPTHSPLI